MRCDRIAAVAALLIISGTVVSDRTPSQPTCTRGAGHQAMVVAAHPAAALSGCKVLATGGSAADAAVAVQAVLAVIEPQSSGLGGGTLITYYETEGRRVRVFDGLAATGQQVTAGLHSPTSDEHSHGVATFGDDVDYTARAVAVPGTIAVLDDIQRRFGRLHWRMLFDDAVALARTGVPVTQYLYDSLNGTNAPPASCAYPDLARLFCDGNQRKNVGAIVRNTELADSLREVRDGGASAFYDPQGPIVQAIIRRLRAGPFDPTADQKGPAVIPSLLSPQDFAAYRPVERAPICRQVLGHMLCTAPPPATGGATLALSLALMQAKNITHHQPDSPGYVHLAIEASRIAGALTRATIADPSHDRVSWDEHTQPAGIDKIASTIDVNEAMHSVEEKITQVRRDGAGSNNNTSHVSIIDRWGNAISMTTTNNLNFGSRLIARGIVLNNAATNFSSPEAEINGMRQNKRPRTSMAPSIVLDPNGRVRLVPGSAGGGPIPDYVAQVILGVLGYGQDPQRAMSRPHVSGQTRNDDCSGRADPYSDIEAGTAVARLLDDLHHRRHPCVRATRLRSGTAAIHVTRDGELIGAADPRRDGAVFGY